MRNSPSGTMPPSNIEQARAAPVDAGSTNLHHALPRDCFACINSRRLGLRFGLGEAFPSVQKLAIRVAYQLLRHF